MHAREVVAQLRKQRDPPFRRVASDFQEETAGRRRSKGDEEGPTAQLYTRLFKRLEAFCASDELAEVSDMEHAVYEEDDGEVQLLSEGISNRATKSSKYLLAPWNRR